LYNHNVLCEVSANGGPMLYDHNICFMNVVPTQHEARTVWCNYNIHSEVRSAK
jgi:hypothetical protein